MTENYNDNSSPSKFWARSPCGLLIKYMVKIVVFTLISVLSLTLISGCGQDSEENYAKVTDDGTVEYNTNDSVDPMNYTIYVNKEITVITNILSTHIANGDNIIKGNYAISTELPILQSDLDLVAEAIKSVETMNPPTDYEDDRTAILTAMLAAQDSLSRYESALNAEGDYSVESCVDLMEGDYITLTGKMQATYWE